MKFIDLGGIGLTQPLTMIFWSLLILVMPIELEAQEEPATLGSMDEQYAWVGDLGDRDALPGFDVHILFGKSAATTTRCPLAIACRPAATAAPH